MGEDDADFLYKGDALVNDLREFAGLQNDSMVLDIGSGYGRVAHALWRSGYRGRYVGLEILERHVRWCETELAPLTDGRFLFRHHDVRNARYNPKGEQEATEVRFELDDGTVDVAVLTSLFTHMYPQEVAHYLAELGRVLDPARGRALVTVFLLDETWEKAEAEGKSQFPMPHELDEASRFHDDSDPLHAIGYRPEWLAARCADAGLTLETLRLGMWCGRDASAALQDMLVLRRV
jgi:SAM-dependent methyltransferase